MKLRIYIVTYKRNDVLNENLRTLWASLPEGTDATVKILANHPDVEILPENARPCLSVVLNTVRMPHAWGNLAKDWNYGLLDGFKTWENPDQVDWVILAQNDVQWQAGWPSKLAGFTKLAFISQPLGDQVMAFRIEAVRRVGFFDERLTTLHFQEIDYFNRAALQLGEAASINDAHAGKFSEWNPVGCFMIKPTSTGVVEEGNLHTARFFLEMGAYLSQKWQYRSFRQAHHMEVILSRRNSWLRHLPREINWYPFFWHGIPELPSSLRWYLRIHTGTFVIRLLKMAKRFLNETLLGKPPRR